MSLVLDIKKRYPGFTLDIQLEAGEERVALLGASGCGKSCTLRCIAGVETPDEGKIVVNGVTFFDSAVGINLSPQDRKCALLFQNYQLFPNMTVTDNVCAGVEDAGDAAARKQLAERYLGIFGLADFADRYPARLSGGQQQRVALARTLNQNPKIILADEPVASLDPITAKQVMQDFVRINKEYKISILLNIHHVDLALKYCDRVIGIRAGEIVFDGPASTITQEQIDEVYNGTKVPTMGEGEGELHQLKTEG